MTTCKNYTDDTMKQYSTNNWNLCKTKSENIKQHNVTPKYKIITLK